MASDGNYIIDTKINTSELQSDLKDVEKQFDSIADAAESIEKEASKAFEDLSDSAKTAYSKIEKIRSDDADDNRTKAAKIAAIYRTLGDDQSDAMKRAWSVIRDESGEGSKRVIDDLQEIEDKAKTTGTKVGGLSDSFDDLFGANLFSNLAVNALEAIGDAAIDMAKESIQAVSDIRAENAQFAQTFKGVEQTARNALEGIAKETGITATRMQKSYTSIYAFTKSVGAKTEDAMDISSRALRAAADSAAYYDKSIEEMTETLQSFLKGNYENDAALNVSATEATRNAAAMERYAKSFDKLNETQRADVLLSMVENANKLSGAYGQAAREADSWTNVTGELSEAWRQFLGVIGAPILDALTPLIQGTTKALNEMGPALVNSLDYGFVHDFDLALQSANFSAQALNETVMNTAIAEEMSACEMAAESTAAAVQQLGMEYDEARAAAMESLDAQIGLFEELVYASDISSAKILKNWQSQQDGLVRYAENLQKAIDMGLDEALVQQLSDGSVESMSILDALVNGVGVEVDTINAEFQKTKEIRNTVTSAMAVVREDMIGKLDEIASDVATEWPGMADVVGQSIAEMQNYINSLTGNMVYVDVVTRYSTTGTSAPATTPQGYSAEPSAAYALPRNVPYLASGAVIPPHAPFYAVLGDQRNGNNLETPEALLRQIVREESGNGTDVNVEFRGELAALARILAPVITKEQRSASRSRGL